MADIAGYEVIGTSTCLGQTYTEYEGPDGVRLTLNQLGLDRAKHDEFVALLDRLATVAVNIGHMSLRKAGLTLAVQPDMGGNQDGDIYRISRARCYLAKMYRGSAEADGHANADQQFKVMTWLHDLLKRHRSQPHELHVSALAHYALIRAADVSIVVFDNFPGESLNNLLTGSGAPGASIATDRRVYEIYRQAWEQVRRCTSAEEQRLLTDFAPSNVLVDAHNPGQLSDPLHEQTVCIIDQPNRHDVAEVAAAIQAIDRSQQR